MTADIQLSIDDCRPRTAASPLTAKTRQRGAEWVIRAGPGPLYLQQTRARHSQEEIEALLDVKFDSDDPLHRDLADTIDIWQRALGQEEDCQ